MTIKRTVISEIREVRAYAIEVTGEYGTTYQEIFATEKEANDFASSVRLTEANCIANYGLSDWAEGDDIYVLCTPSEPKKGKVVSVSCFLYQPDQYVETYISVLFEGGEEPESIYLDNRRYRIAHTPEEFFESK